MTRRRWVEVSFVFLILALPRIAGAVVITPSAASTSVGNVVVNQTGASSAITLTTDTNNYNVDLVVSGCTAGSSATAKVGGNSTNIQLKTASPSTVAVTLTPTTRGAKTCTVTVYDTGTVTPSRAVFTINGTGIAPVISVPASINFATPIRYNDAAAVSSTTLPLTITNTSTDAGQNLTINNVTLSGTGMNDYSITPPGSNVIAPNSGTQTWTITFNPVAAGASNATITIDSTDPLNPTRTVPLSGTGGTAVMGVTATLAFGIVGQGTTSSAQNIVISNNGAGTKAAMNVTAANFANNGAGWFKFNGGAGCNGTASCALSLNITGVAGTLPIVCAPPANASGSQSAMVQVTSDADDNSANTTMVTCTAGRADIMVTTTTLDFGDVVINTTSANQTVMIANSGNATLTYNIALTGANPGQFTIAGNACTTNCSVSAMSSVMVVVAFKPTAVGAKTANLSVTPTNDPDTAGPIDVPLMGNCTAPLLALNVTPPLAFGAIDVGAMSTAQTLTVTNNGSSTLTVSGAFLQAGAADYVTTGMTGPVVSIPIAPASTYSWTIACKPTQQGARPGNFRITSDTGGTAGQITDVGLTCTGNKGTLVVATTPYDFGASNQGFMYTHNFTLTNTGNVTVSNITITTSGTGTGYSIPVPATFPTSIAAGVSVPFTVQFHPLDGTYGGAYAFTFTGVWGGANTPTASTLDLNGDGLTTGFDTSPSNPTALDIGDVRFDGSTTKTFNVLNTTGNPYQVQNMTIVPDAGTASGEISFVSCTHGGGAAAANPPSNCPNGTAYFSSPAVMNDTMIVTLKCQPASRVGMIGATIRLNSNLANPDDLRTLKVKCNATTGILNVNPGNLVDFGPVDLDNVPVAVTKTVTLTNMGAAPLSLGGALPPAGRFAFTSMPAAAVPPGGNYSFDVTYTPNMERLESQPDTQLVTMALVGVYGMPIPNTVTLTIQGHGVDRHIALGPVPIFPDTFKNPGTKAPVLPVTVTNNGDANLHLSAAMVSDGPVWTIENPEAADVAGRASYDFRVKLNCITTGKAPTGHLVIEDNDNGMPMVGMDLDGNCIDRQVAFGPPVVDLGYVGIGIPTRLSESAHMFLDVSNMDDVNPFQITSIGIDGGNGAFEVVDSDNKPPTALDLSPRTTRQFDVIFTPNYEGDFQASASLYLDESEDAHATVLLRGRGLYVDVRGGGGCSTGRGSGGAMILVLGALLAGRRRRRRGLLAAVAGIAGLGGVASAETRNLDTSLLDPTPATHVSGLQTQSADVGESGEYAASALFSYANDTLILDAAQNDYGAIQSRMMLQLGGAYAFGEKFEAGLRMPLYFQSGQGEVDPHEMFGIVPVGSTARGDATLHIKMHAGAIEALGGDLSYGFAGALTIPTRSGKEFAGTNMPQGRLLALATQTNGRLVTQLNVGALIRSKDRYSSLVQRSGATFGIGATYRALDKIWIGGEVFGNLIPGGHTDQPAMGETYGAPATMSSIEALAELTYSLGRTSSLGVALGRGVTSGVGTSNFRGAVMLAFTPGATVLAPIHPYRAPEPPKDTDGDGVKDKQDACPNEPEDKDMFEDGDGCPDLDNDNDGISDDKDKCPLDPEDKDRFQDEDGCPEKDNDNDGVADDKDKCPLTAEDKDGFQDNDGCPDPDNDGDGIVDTADKCPKEAETINGNNDDDGCPDKGNALVVLSPDRLDALESIQFVGGGTKIASSSKNVLGQIGATLRAHPEIERVRLTAHVNPTSSASRDQRLSEERAKAVREWLVDWGIDPLRMQSSGFGGSKPLVPASQRGAQQINDRFEIIVLERK